MSKNPFDDDYRAGSLLYSSNIKSYSTAANTIEDEADYYEKEIERYMQESLDSTERSRRHLENSEKVGVQTAQDLLEQREKLEKTEANLDEIHATTQAFLLGPLGALAIIPMCLTWFFCEYMARKRQVNRVKTMLGGNIHEAVLHKMMIKGIDDI